MTSFPDQFSAVRQSQWEAQLDMFRQLSTRALDNTEQLIALNMRVSRASMEQAAGAVKQMLDMRDPRDLLAAGSSAQDQWQQLFSYGRELLGIATGMRGTWTTLPPALPFVPTPVLPALSSASPALRLIPAPLPDAPAAPSLTAEQASIAAADAATVIGEIEAAAVDIGGAVLESTLDGEADVAPSSEAEAPAAFETAAAVPEETPADVPAQAPAEPDNPVEPDSPADAALAFADAASDTAIADDVPPLEATPLAQALNEVAPKPAGVEHPIVSTVPLEAAAGAFELPAVAPVEHTAPPAQPTRPPRTARKR
ncbi:phasin family protein [Massilia sp. 9096]|uniref:phasin family protein n=1 Tax=Massilia sp. 9096 TaxID=1500894 RepID=UPI00068D883F|nr:phasin family protein [Massilia sp. 9096]